MQWLVCEIGPADVNHEFDNVYTFRTSKDTIKQFYTSEKVAQKAAQDKAVANPTRQFAVFAIASIYETSKPTFVVKKLNANGEIVVA